MSGVELHNPLSCISYFRCLSQFCIFGTVVIIYYSFTFDIV